MSIEVFPTYKIIQKFGKHTLIDRGLGINDHMKLRRFSEGSSSFKRKLDSPKSAGGIIWYQKTAWQYKFVSLNTEF